MASSLERAIARHRAQLRSVDRAAMAELLTVYQGVEARLAGLITALQQQALADGIVTPYELFQLERWRELQLQTATELERLARATGDVTAEAQARAVRASLNGTADLAEAAARGQVATARVVASWVQLPTSAVEDLVGAARSGPLADLLATFGETGQRVITEELVKGFSLGEGPRSIANAITKGLDISRNRALTIARTETLRAARSSAERGYAQNRDILAGWIWSAAKDEGTCAACLAMDGTGHPHGERMDSHVNCFVAGTMVNGPKAIAGTERWYSGDVIEIETEGGRRLTVTPNHPILTPEGWVAAGFLNEGSNLVSGSFGQINPVLPYRDYDHVPTGIEQVAKSFGRDGRMITVGVPTATEDFHGDGAGSKISVVRANGLLWDGFDPTCSQHFSKFDLVMGSMRHSFLSGLRLPFQFFDWALHTAHRIMCSLREATALFWAGLRHAEIHALASPAWRYAIAHQSSSNAIAIDAVSRSKDLFRLTGKIAAHEFAFGDGSLGILGSNSALNRKPDSFGIRSVQPTLAEHLPQANRAESAHALADDLHSFPGDITSDRILKFSRRAFAGHVYNLQTIKGWYFANGIISHNCRCAAIPWLRNIPMAEYETGENWLARQGPETQDGVLGKSGGEAYRAGEVQLSDFVRVDHSETWGRSIRDGGIGWARWQAGQERRAA